MNAKSFVCFLMKLIREAKQGAFHIVDPLPNHKARQARERVDVDKKGIEFFYLPPY